MPSLFRTFGVIFVVAACPIATTFAQTQPSPPQLPGQISADEAKRFEVRLTQDPDDLAAHESLIQYYFQQGVSSRTPEIEKDRETHIFWLIEHHPESELAGSPEAQILPGLPESAEGYVRAKDLWLQQVQNHSDEKIVLRNAGEFFLVPDAKTARELLEKAWAMDSKDVQTSSALAQAYELEASHTSSSEEKLAVAKKAVSVRESTLGGLPEEQRFDALGDLAKSALEAGEPEKAQQYAEELLKLAAKFKNDWNYGNALHQGNLILGRIALQRGDIESAKTHLVAAGQTPGSPQLDSFGPNMALANDLLAKGERETVLTYLQSCGKFWKTGADKLEAWTATIKGGGMPDFGANLSY